MTRSQRGQVRAADEQDALDDDAAQAEATAEGWATLSLRRSVGYAGVPLGPCRSVLDLPATSDLAALAEAVAGRLAPMR